MSFDPELDLEIERVMAATPAQIWRCWAELDFGLYVLRHDGTRQEIAVRLDGLFFILCPPRNITKKF